MESQNRKVSGGRAFGVGFGAWILCGAIVAIITATYTSSKYDVASMSYGGILGLAIGIAAGCVEKSGKYSTGQIIDCVAGAAVVLALLIIAVSGI